MWSIIRFEYLETKEEQLILDKKAAILVQVAAEHNYPDFMKLLVEHGANINATTNSTLNEETKEKSLPL